MTLGHCAAFLAWGALSFGAGMSWQRCRQVGAGKRWFRAVTAWHREHYRNLRDGRRYVPGRYDEEDE